MRSVCIAFAVGLSVAAFGQAKPTLAPQVVATAAEANLKLTIPKQYRPMTKAEIGIKFPGTAPPKEAWANSELNVSIAVTYPENGFLKPEDLQKFTEAIADAVSKVRKNLKWVRRTQVTINGQKWQRLTFTCDAIDTQIYNDMVFTSHKGRMLGVNCNSVVRLRRQSEAQFDATIQSLKIENKP